MVGRVEKKNPMSFVPAKLFAESTPSSGRHVLVRRPGNCNIGKWKRDSQQLDCVLQHICLLLKYACHINVVVQISVNLIKYLYKYK
jgi:hypothetical protein